VTLGEEPIAPDFLPDASSASVLQQRSRRYAERKRDLFQCESLRESKRRRRFMASGARGRQGRLDTPSPDVDRISDEVMRHEGRWARAFRPLHKNEPFRGYTHTLYLRLTGRLTLH
jgi:hypothetical protein